MLPNHLVPKFSGTAFRLVHSHGISHPKPGTAGGTTTGSPGRASQPEHVARGQEPRWGSTQSPVPLGPRRVSLAPAHAEPTRGADSAGGRTVHSFRYSKSFQESGWMDLPKRPVRHSIRTRQKAVCPSGVSPGTPQSTGCACHCVEAAGERRLRWTALVWLGLPQFNCQQLLMRCRNKLLADTEPSTDERPAHVVRSLKHAAEPSLLNFSATFTL